MYRKISAILIPCLIAVGILAYMLYQVWDDLVVSFEHIVPAYLALAVIICLAAWWLRGWRYHRILLGLNYRIKVAVTTACVFVSQMVNLIVPARLGDFVRIFILRHEYKTTYSEGISSIVVERVFDIITVALLGAIAFFFIPNVPGWIDLYIIIPLAICGVFFLFLIFVGKLTTTNKYVRYLLTMLEEIRRASLTVTSAIILSFSSIVIWLLDTLVCYCVVLMFGQQISFAVVLLAVVIGNLVKAVPITPGGIGTYEFAVAATMGIAGVPYATAVSIAIIDHDLIKNLITAIGGIISIKYLGSDWVIDTIKSALSERFNGGKSSDP